MWDEVGGLLLIFVKGVCIQSPELSLNPCLKQI